MSDTSTTVEGRVTFDPAEYHNSIDRNIALFQEILTSALNDSPMDNLHDKFEVSQLDISRAGPATVGNNGRYEYRLTLQYKGSETDE